MEHMIDAVEFPGPLHGDHILGLRHHADHAMIPSLIITDRTDILVSQVLTDGAGPDRRFGVGNGGCKFRRRLRRHTQDVKSQPLRRLSADARQSCKLFRQPLQCGRKVPHLTAARSG